MGKKIFFLFLFFSLLLFLPQKLSAKELLRPLPEKFGKEEENLSFQPSLPNQPPFAFFWEIISSSWEKIHHFTFPKFFFAKEEKEENLAVNLPSFQKSFFSPTPSFSPLPDQSIRAQQVKSLLSTLEEKAKENPLSLPSPTSLPLPTLIAQVNQEAENRLSFFSREIFPTTPPPPLPTLPETVGEIKENPQKPTFVFALLGDSMVETLGETFPHLQQELKLSFPQYSFALLNYGQGATDLESGLKRLSSASAYLGKIYPPLLSFKPDFLVVESFAYNHWSGQFFDLDRQWLTFAKIVDKVKELSPRTKIIFAATVAPNSRVFGDGVLNWPENLKRDSALITKAYLQNLINFATSQDYPLADAFHPSLDENGEGILKYINGGDHLHPSEEGKGLFAQKIIEAIRNYRLLK